MTRFTHTEARAIICEAFRRVFGREPNRTEAQCAQAVGYIESGYGAHWKPPGVDSNNWGAIQAGGSWKGETFVYTDTRPNPDGTSTPYQIAFRKYPTPIEGAVDLVKRVYTGGKGIGREKAVHPFAAKGDTLGFSTGLYDTVYYQGFGPTREDRIRNHHRGLMRAISAMATEIGEPMPDGSDAPRPTLRRGDKGPRVAELQRLIGVKADGDFGPRTDQAVRDRQREERLVPDGIVGPATWFVFSRYGKP